MSASSSTATPDDRPSSERERPRHASRNAWSGILFGVGLVAFIDETVFHQLLRWHHFYDRAGTQVGLISDGIFHAVSWFATIGGLFLLADLRRRDGLSWLRWSGGVLAGAGAFQLYDGLVQHKLWRIHQIRAVDDLLAYDIVWNVVATVLLVAGVVLLIRTGSAPRRCDTTEW
ncbi:hypothetical protein CVS47_01742 [Microbacterium lemovicicum]|uniref:DUF2243 domain-containing protein n=1 Tax=Microbacterium lemovicicum TaxID=1072463 RepID=A0A3Q9J067_9MICO|nr:DUF2243 domain-containing protein [Microbacterium lemovicicum]AZS37114.1 hypothetical protein CVS47_01742 [Microbacterium lemovicicum]